MARPSVRGKLIEAGLDSLHAQGFNGCSIQNIVDAAKVPKGSFFNHFKSKELLALEAVQRYGQSSRMDILFDAAQPPLARLRNHFEYLAETYANRGYERGCLLGNFSSEMASSHPQMRETLKGIFDAWCAVVTSIIREAQTAGDVDPSRDAGTLSDFVVNAWQGVVMRLKLVRERGPVDEFFTVCFGLVLAPAAAKPTLP